MVVYFTTVCPYFYCYTLYRVNAKARWQFYLCCVCPWVWGHLGVWGELASHKDPPPQCSRLGTSYPLGSILLSFCFVWCLGWDYLYIPCIIVYMSESIYLQYYLAWFLTAVWIYGKIECKSEKLLGHLMSNLPPQ